MIKVHYVYTSRFIRFLLFLETEFSLIDKAFFIAILLYWRSFRWKSFSTKCCSVCFGSILGVFTGEMMCSLSVPVHLKDLKKLCNPEVVPESNPNSFSHSHSKVKNQSFSCLISFSFFLKALLRMTTALRKVFTTCLVVHCRFKNLPIYCLCPLFKCT